MEWKDMPNTYGYYQVSESGEVRSWVRKGFSWQPKRDTPYIMKIPVGKRGYYEQSFNMVEIGVIKRLKIHRLVATLFIENPYNYNVVNHINGNKLDNRVENLEWCTQKDNVRHAFKNGLMPTGEKHSLATLSNREVLEIFNADGDGYKEIADKYSTNEDIVYSIKSGHAWSSVTGKIYNKAK